MCRGIRWTSLWGFFSPKETVTCIFWEHLLKHKHAHVSERHQHKKPTFYWTTLNSIKVQSHSSHHFRKREKLPFPGIFSPATNPLLPTQHLQKPESVSVQLLSLPFPSSALLLSWQNREDSVSLQETRERAIHDFRGPYLPPTQRLHIQLPCTSYLEGI